ncbi:gliding motility-associated ABC transporter substrate-binding protein GldG [Olivibacter domesticus]|uniref:ABC-2 type transport system permease protein n=1 Tax=Olivibacter domesticus TaxID=407022 RepID=A0A1H7V595_OLID1|nr:gliding motility-associated ABC transporter substrate-binding protein GldG [Olivibacter domesticus]SEM04260.1 ABC-2 type transport system permease protein [Olivibacter domesticus]
MFSIFKKDIFSFFNSLVGYLTIGLFLFVTGLFLWVFPETSVLSYGYATLDGFFALAPYIFLFIIPAITMRSIASERAEGTYELLITKPINFIQLITAKYLSCLTIIVLSILPTLIYYISIYSLGAPTGNIDTGAVIGSYIGLVLLGAAFASIGVFASTISPNVIVAYLFSTFLSFSFYAGFDFLAGVFTADTLSDVLAFLGIHSHYESVSRGVLDARDFCYFLGVILFFLSLTYLFFERDRHHIKGAGKLVLYILLFIIVINYLAANIFFRIDFTSEKRYTLSEVSKSVLNVLEEDLHVVVFLNGDLPPGFKRLQSGTKDLLSDLKAYAGGRIRYTFINPTEGDVHEQEQYMDALAKRGIEPTKLSVKTEEGLTQKMIYPVAVLMYGEEELPINLLQNNRFLNPEEVLNNSVQNLEYTFINGIKKITSGGRPIIAFTEGHGELNDLEAYDAMHSLGYSYQAGRLNLDSISFETLKEIRVIVVAKPQTPFTEYQKFKLDYFVQHGGKVLWALNQVQGELDSMRKSGDQIIVASNLNLDDMLFKYGVRLNYNLLADLNCAQIPLNVGNVGQASQLQLVPWIFYPIFIPKSDHPIVKNIDGIKGEFVGTIDTLAVKNIEKEILLSSSTFNKVSNVPVLISLDMVSSAPKPEEFKAQAQTVAVALEGSFPSIFKNRPLPAGIPDTLSTNPAKPSLRNKMVVFADGNMLKNEVNKSENAPYNLGWDRATQQQYGNKTLLLNTIDYLCDESGIISLRNKEVKLRLLDKMSIKTDKLLWQFINVCLPPLALILFGIMQQLVRKRKFSKQ